MNQYKVLVLDPISEDGIKELLDHPNYEVDIKTGRSEAEILDIVHDYHAMIVRSQTTITEEIIQYARSLKVIARAGVGVDNIDIDAATKYGVIVVNAPDGNTISATEHTMAMMLALTRDIPAAHKELSEGVWNRKAYKGTEMYGKTLGIIGVGKIGFGVARRAQSFGMKIVAFDPYLSEEKAKEADIEKMEVENIAEHADFVTVHTPLTPQTRGIVGKAFFEAAKPELKIVNVARGGIIDEAALLEALDEGQIDGAALDVFEEEPPTNQKLLNHPRIVVTPHLGASTVEAQEKVAISVSREIINILENNTIVHAVNAPRMSENINEELKPFINISSHMGKVAIQLMNRPPMEIKLKYHGDLALDDTSILTRSFVANMLKPHLGENVNIINALYLLQEQDVTYKVEKKGQTHGYSNYLEAELVNNEETLTIGASVLNGYGERIVKINGFQVDIKPTKHLLFINHLDRPGIIGEMGFTLGKYDINIASMQLGRKDEGGAALLSLRLDQSVNDEAIEELTNIEGFHKVKQVDLS
ncbi:phosphoglycerate dehydrogenase [Salinicoccus roseus]|uniref:phosphoglycerate dehydrogenase n=1 Tax=Salinicoccus roseus TaxID=45670 RepID=UPI001EF60F93|nr:phosphoglycerate dehydrogenase [Salinicoccus roseus]MCG7331393.1 phosphoglycerate dehydrogenase [Salinicoccus roseus]